MDFFIVTPWEKRVVKKLPNPALAEKHSFDALSSPAPLGISPAGASGLPLSASLISNPRETGTPGRPR